MGGTTYSVFGAAGEPLHLLKAEAPGGLTARCGVYLPGEQIVTDRAFIPGDTLCHDCYQAVSA